MAAPRITSSDNPRRNHNTNHPHGFMELLSSAACEWFLIFMIFVQATLSYVVTKFANYCELQTPCLICSRIDHLFESKKSGHHWSLLLCNNHAKEISCLVSCQIHGKLSDVRRTCKECQNSSSKTGIDCEQCGFHISFSKNYNSDSLIARTCSCCNKPLGTKTKHSPRLLRISQVGIGASVANVKPPLPRFLGRSRFGRRNSLKRTKDKNSDTMSHVGYTRLKINSDSESEVQFSDDEDEKADGETQINDTRDMPSLLDQSWPLAEDLGRGLVEFNWGEADAKLISLDDVQSAHPRSQISELISTFPDLSELLSLTNDVASSSNAVEIPNKAPSMLNDTGLTHFTKLDLRRDQSTIVEQLSTVDFSKTNDDSKSISQTLSTSEIDGYESVEEIGADESSFSRLKRQAEHDRRCLNALYKELEEERNASAIATNQAMAMITRLQEEKAALHMEALQYLRMMEEQAEYDMDALQKANDLLAEKENEIKNLEQDLEFCRTSSSSPLDFEDEKTYISQRLKKLRLEIHRGYSEATSDFPNGGNNDLGRLAREISELNERFEAFRADFDFLEHACNSLRNGKEGLEFLQEIAIQLQDLRKIEFKR